jgi:predicted PurR-regulated permease PerM
MNTRGQSAYFLLLLIAGALFLVGQIFMPFLAILALAGACASVMWPVYVRTRSLFKDSGDLSAILVSLLVFVGILSPLLLIFVTLGWEVAKLYGSVVDGSFVQNVSAVLREAQQSLPHYFAGNDYTESIASNLSAYASEGLLWLSSHITDAFSSIAGMVLDLFIFFVGFFFFLRDGESIKAAIIKLSPLDDKDDAMIFETLAQAVNSVIRGNILIALIRGIFAAGGFLLVGLPNPLLWGIVAGIVGLLPGLGISLVFIPAILYMYFTGSWVAAFGLLLWGLFVVGLIDNVLAPGFVGRGMQVHPLLVFLSIFGGVGVFGALGIFLGPLCVSFLFALLSIYSARRNLREQT